MFTLLGQRSARGDEEGFTLIELMVVVLIIGILLAIAIPTYLGARSKANDRSAQSNLRHALTAEKTVYSDNLSFTDTSSAGNISRLAGIEPSLTWATGPAAAFSTPRQVVATVPAGGSTVIVAAKSASGTCFYIGDIAGTGTSGVYYMADSTCSTPTGVPANPTNAHASSANATWSLSF